MPNDELYDISYAEDFHGFSNLCIHNDTYDGAAELTLQEALTGSERDKWKTAMKDELQCFEDNEAWELVDTPQNGKIVKCKWVLRKYDADNKVRFRARLVAKGYSQEEGVDFKETFSPVVRHTTLRMLFALSVQLGLQTNHLDVTTAFLNGDLEETIYMSIPEMFPDVGQTSKVLKLSMAIYGLKQSSRAWYKKIDECLLAIGYQRSKLEPCMYTKVKDQSKTIVTLYVDDFFIFQTIILKLNF